MDERLRFVARLLDGEGMSSLCREFGISRKTGYKIYDRYRSQGLEAFTDRSRRPVRYANQLPTQIESLIVRLKQDKSHWRARKLRELLLRRLAGDLRVSACCLTAAILSSVKFSSSCATVMKAERKLVNERCFTAALMRIARHADAYQLCSYCSQRRGKRNSSFFLSFLKTAGCSRISSHSGVIMKILGLPVRRMVLCSLSTI